jgi:hypothetical protein
MMKPQNQSSATQAIPAQCPFPIAWAQHALKAKAVLTRNNNQNTEVFLNRKYSASEAFAVLRYWNHCSLHRMNCL